MNAKARLRAAGSNSAGGGFKLSRTICALAAVAAASAALTIGSAAADDDSRHDGLAVVGLTADQRLVWFWAHRPRKLYEIGTVVGLNAADTALVPSCNNQ